MPRVSKNIIFNSHSISDEWVPSCDGNYTKTVNIKRMRSAEKIKVESLLMTAYKMPYSPNLFDVIGDENDEEEEEASDDSGEDDGNSKLFEI